jgi:hypothetical protein
MPSAGRQPLLVLERRPATMSTPVAHVLWEPETVFRWLAALTLGGALVLGGWWSVAGKAVYSKQVLGLDVAVTGLILAQLGGLYLLLQGRRAVGIRRLALFGDPSPELPGTDGFEVYPVEVVRVADSHDLVAGEGRARYHRVSCPLAADRGFTTASRAQHESAGRRPCGVCQP